ncbi:MAG: TolC family protein [Bacteroidota bacterium]
MCIQANAQSSIMQLSLVDAENIFLKNNLLLLAQQYNISAKQALIIQAKTIPNPVFNVDLNVYDPQNKKSFHIDSSGQKSFQLQQLILLGGKRKIEIDIAKQNKTLAESEFTDLLSRLRTQLHQYFFNVNSEKIVIENYIKQLNVLDTIIDEYKVQANKGNLPLKDVIRLKSVYIKLNADKAELSKEFNENQKQLKLLLQTNQEILTQVPDESFNNFLILKPIAELQSMATSNRADLKMADANTLLAALYLKQQKKQVIPDIAINGSYDQRGGAFRNQINAGITMPIPVFNTNRGNIKAAEFDQKAMNTYLIEKKLEVELDVQQAWANMQRSINEYLKIKDLYDNQFQMVNDGIRNNFQLRNISILEFVDFVEAYNESLSDFENTKRQVAQSAAIINYVTASKIY